jgi:nitrogen fixation protein FixH
MDGSSFGIGRAAPSGQSAWRLFPWVLSGVMAFVVAVNVGLVVTALRSFPGAAQGNGFVMSNAYNRVLQDEAKEEALGWMLAVDLDSQQRPTLMLKDRDGHPMDRAGIEAVATRPLGPEQATKLTMQPAGAGRYLADKALARGQWDVAIQVRQDTDLLRAVHRLIVP